MMDFNRLFFSLDGRISRKQFWIGILALTATSIVLTLVLSRAVGVTIQDFASETPSPKMALVDVAAKLILFYPGLAVFAKRLHDRGFSMLLGVLVYAANLGFAVLDYFGLSAGADSYLDAGYLLFLAPFILLTLWLIVELGVLRGARGDNRYGPDPLAESDQQPIDRS